MESVKLRVTLYEDGSVKCESSSSDVGLVLIILEKAKADLLSNVKLEKKSSILTPESMN